MRKLAATFSIVIPEFQLSEIRYFETYTDQARKKTWRQNEHETERKKRRRRFVHEPARKKIRRKNDNESDRKKFGAEMYLNQREK